MPPKETDHNAAIAWFGCVVVLLAALVFARCTAPAHAQDLVELAGVDEELAVAVARVAAHEAGFRSPADLALIWQAARGHGDTSAERLAWLELHSPRALTGDHWSVSLPAEGDAQPEGWPDAIAWSRFSTRWAPMLAASRRLVATDAPPRAGWPCSETPATWGGRVVDREHVARHAHVYRALDCRDPITGEPTRNEGYQYRRPR